MTPISNLGKHMINRSFEALQLILVYSTAQTKNKIILLVNKLSKEYLHAERKSHFWEKTQSFGTFSRK